jgi:hypothetical protein
MLRLKHVAENKVNKINIQVHFVGYLYFMDPINAWKMEHIPYHLQLLKAHMFIKVVMCFIRKCNI